MEKKTEILKCRIDRATFVALQTLCDETEQTVSEALRLIIARELAGRQKVQHALPSEIAWGAPLTNKHERAECARVLSAIIVRPPSTSSSNGRMENYRRKAARLLESLFGAMESSGSVGGAGERMSQGGQPDIGALDHAFRRRYMST